jgi:hypothetical protein
MRMDSYARGQRFECRICDLLSYWDFWSSFSALSDEFKDTVSDNRSVPHPFEFIIFNSPLIRHYIVVSWGGVRLSPLGTSATNWPTVPVLDDRWLVWSSRWNENWQGKPKCSEKTCLSATLFTSNPKSPDLCSNPGRRGGKPATNLLSCGTAHYMVCAAVWASLNYSWVGQYERERMCFAFKFI